jgi:hypothetical protein
LTGKIPLSDSIVGKQPLFITGGLAQAGHYLAWRNFSGKEKIILSRASLLEATPASQAPERWAQVVDSATEKN